MDYTADAAAALDMIREAGATVAIKRPGGVFDPAAGAVTGTTGETTGTLSAVMLPRFKGAQFAALDNAFREALVSGKAKTVLAAAAGATFPPEPGDVLTIGGVEWRAVGVTVLAPDGVVPILYTIGVLR